MLRRHIVLTLLILLSGLRLAGQTGSDQTKISLAYPVYSQYLHNGLLINPAYAGSREVLSLFYREGFNGPVLRELRFRKLFPFIRF